MVTYKDVLHFYIFIQKQREMEEEEEQSRQYSTLSVRRRRRPSVEFGSVSISALVSCWQALHLDEKEGSGRNRGLWCVPDIHRVAICRWMFNWKAACQRKIIKRLFFLFRPFSSAVGISRCSSCVGSTTATATTPWGVIERNWMTRTEGVKE